MKSVFARLPALSWLQAYQRPWLTADLLAGITVAMMLIPQAMSYAMLAGVPPYMGLYASVLPLIIYALFGTSRHLAVGPVAMVALLVASGVAVLAEPGSPEYIELVITLALMIGVIQLLMGVFRLGFLTNFMSHPVISGFTSAAALIIGFSQLAALTGLVLPRTENIFLLSWLTLTNAANVHLLTFTLGLSGVMFLLAMKKWLPKLPAAMLLMIISTLLVWLGQWQLQGVRVVGQVPAGLPDFALPSLAWGNVQALLPMALTISFIAFMESIAVAKKIANEQGYAIKANQELVGLGLANVAASVFRGMPVTGGFSRTALNTSAGAKTPLAAMITALVVGLSLLTLTPLFFYIPMASLAAVIMVAVINLFDWHEVKHLWQVKREDLALWGLSFAATLVLGVKLGILLAIVGSMLWFVIKTTRPHYAVLGQLPGTDLWRNQARYPEAQSLPGLLALRFDAQFYYGNVSFFQEVVAEQLAKGQGWRWVLLDASSINQLDSSADSALHDMVKSLRKQGIELHFAAVKGPVLDVMHRSGFIERLGEDHFHPSMGAALNHFYQPN